MRELPRGHLRVRVGGDGVRELPHGPLLGRDGGDGLQQLPRRQLRHEHGERRGGGLPGLRRWGLRCRRGERLHFVRRGEVPELVGRVELRKLRRGKVFPARRNDLHLLRGGNLPGQLGPLALRELRGRLLLPRWRGQLHLVRRWQVRILLIKKMCALHSRSLASLPRLSFSVSPSTYEQPLARKQVRVDPWCRRLYELRGWALRGGHRGRQWMQPVWRRHLFCRDSDYVHFVHRWPLPAELHFVGLRRLFRGRLFGGRRFGVLQLRCWAVLGWYGQRRVHGVRGGPIRQLAGLDRVRGVRRGHL